MLNFYDSNCSCATKVKLEFHNILSSGRVNTHKCNDSNSWFSLSQSVSQMLLAYLSRFSAIADNKINCGPALTWMEVRLSSNSGENIFSLCHKFYDTIEQSVIIKICIIINFTSYTKHNCNKIIFMVKKGLLCMCVRWTTRETTYWSMKNHPSMFLLLLLLMSSSVTSPRPQTSCPLRWPQSRQSNLPSSFISLSHINLWHWLQTPCVGNHFTKAHVETNIP